MYKGIYLYGIWEIGMEWSWNVWRVGVWVWGRGLLWGERGSEGVRQAASGSVTVCNCQLARLYIYYLLITITITPQQHTPHPSAAAPSRPPTASIHIYITITITIPSQSLTRVRQPLLIPCRLCFCLQRVAHIDNGRAPLVVQSAVGPHSAQVVPRFVGETVSAPSQMPCDGAQVSGVAHHCAVAGGHRVGHCGREVLWGLYLRICIYLMMIIVIICN